MFQVIPAIGTLLALAAFFFAVYYRTAQKYAQIGVDSVREIGELPSKSRLDATKILINVFDLDIKALAPDQQFQLALKTFEKREKESRRNFLALLSGGVILLLFAAGYGISKMDGASMIRTALIVDHASAMSELNAKGFFSTSDTQLVDRLARSAVVDRDILDPFERVEKFRRILDKQPTVRELRERADNDIAPFEVAGEIMRVGVPRRADQPPRFIAFVRRQSPLAGRLITVQAKGRNEYVRLFAKGAVDVESPADVQLNFEQFSEVFGDKPRETLKKALVTPTTQATAIDPSCPKYEGFSITTCDLPQSVPTSAIPSLQS